GLAGAGVGVRVLGGYRTLELVGVWDAEDVIADLRGGRVRRAGRHHDDARWLQHVSCRDRVAGGVGPEHGNYTLVNETVRAGNGALDGAGVIAHREFDGHAVDGRLLLVGNVDAVQRVVTSHRHAA